MPLEYQWSSTPDRQLFADDISSGDFLKIYAKSGRISYLVSWEDAIAGLHIVSGPSDSTSTDNAIVRWDGTDGLTIQNSTVVLTDDGRIGFGYTPTAYYLQMYVLQTWSSENH